MKLTQADIEATGSYEFADNPKGSHWFTGYIPSPLFGSTVKVHISLVDGLKTISEKQVQIVNDFLALGPDSIPHIKSKLFEHWLYCEDSYEPGEFDIKTEEDAYANAKFEELLIWTTDRVKGRGANLCFEVEWEYEHGISIVLWNGELKDAHDIQDYFFDYEPIGDHE